MSAQFWNRAAIFEWLHSPFQAEVIWAALKYRCRSFANGADAGAYDAVLLEVNLHIKMLITIILFFSAGTHGMGARRRNKTYSCCRVNESKQLVAFSIKKLFSAWQQASTSSLQPWAAFVIGYHNSLGHGEPWGTYGEHWGLVISFILNDSMEQVGTTEWSMGNKRKIEKTFCTQPYCSWLFSWNLALRIGWKCSGKQGLINISVCIQNENIFIHFTRYFDNKTCLSP